MSESLQDKLSKNLSKLTRKQRLIVDYIIDNYQNAAFFTAKKLGEAVGVSEATIVRFAKEYGYEGYPELQRELRELVRSRLDSIQRIDLLGARMDGESILKATLEQDAKLLIEAKDAIDRKSFDKTVDALCSARRIYIVATRSAEAVAVFIKYYLSIIFESVIVVDASNESDVLEKLLFVGSDDVILAVSYPRYSKRMSQTIAYIAQRNAKIIALTDSQDAPIAKSADILLLTGSDIVSIVDSLIAPMSLANALIVACVLRKKGELQGRFTDIEEAWTQYEVYEATAVDGKAES